MSILPTEEYKKIIETMPILCVDVVILNAEGKYLLVKRANEPLRGKWWVIGGRVLKDETMEHAVRRKIKQEIGLEVDVVKPIGYYEDQFDKNPFDAPTMLHTVSIVFSTLVDGDQQITLDGQSTAWEYFDALPDNFRIIPFS